VKQSVRKKRKNRYKKTKHEPMGLLRQRLSMGCKGLGGLAFLLVFSAMLVLAYAAITTCDYFGAETIEITGNSHMSRQDILSQADLRPQDNILALNLRIIRKRLISHPWISSARVARQIPHTITISVEEQRPLAVLELGGRLLVSDQGIIFKEYALGDPVDLPVITGIEYADLNVDHSPLSQPMQAAVQVLTLSRSHESALPYDDIAGLHVDRETGVVLTMKDKERLIKLGFGQFAEKNKKIGQLLKFLEDKPLWRDVYALDANNPDRIVVQQGSSRQAKTTGA
jgi:cell division septal protein FtsQ